MYFEKRPMKRVKLPSDKTLWVDIYTKFTWKQEKEIGDLLTAGVSQPDAILRNIIAEWNLTDETGIAPIDNDHIDLLEREDAIALISAVNEIEVEDEEQKKASPKA